MLADEACIEWVRQRLTAIAPSLEDVWSAGAHLGAVSEFLTSHTSGRLFAYIDAGSGELRLQTTVPPAWEKLLYMVRDASKFITADNIDANVHYGLVNGSTMDNMLQIQVSHRYIGHELPWAPLIQGLLLYYIPCIIMYSSLLLPV